MNFNVENEKPNEQGSTNEMFSVLSDALDKPELRVTGIYGDITEEKCSEAVYGLLALYQTGKSFIQKNPDDPDSELVEVCQPIEFYISTYGGQASEMFAVYDMMRMLREEIAICTYGIGKVMSAGVLLLAAGTKGERRIGKNCRVMIHGVISGQHGHIADVENEFSEAKMTQKLYVNALVKETKMTEKDIRKMINKKTNVYIDAEKAVELGIADIVF